jgi:hypothetical protein
MIEYTNLPYLHIDAEPIKDISPLSNSDSDLHISSSINFNYYSPNDFKGNEDIRDRSLFMEGGEGNFFFPKFLKLKAPP